MALPVRDQLKYWGAAALLAMVLLWWLGGVILPFVLGMAIAYALDPIADRLEALGLGRTLAVAIITVLSILIFLAAVLVLIPLLISQGASLIERLAVIIERLPARLEIFQLWLAETHPALLQKFPGFADLDAALEQMLGTATSALRARAGMLVEGVVASLSGVLNTLLLFVVVPVVAFYMLLDWDRMVAEVDKLLPREHAPTIRRLAGEIDRTLASFVRGQGTVCLILGVYYAAALALVGLQFGIVVGAIAGFLTFIPYVGALVGGVLAIGLALFQFWGDWFWIIAVWAIFQSGQFVEGNFLTPKLVGSSVGLHPVWLLFALSAFGALFGFVGLLVAVPVAAAMGVIARFATQRYRDSALYAGANGQSGEGPGPR
ncbi:AI-2E family transporter [Palleronia sediminis]|uniref:AI-2E family transporter n=1 Tax=Palleronia sediminis TaxID=2547833 RepID=A0A4R6AEC5_9RHOB|nr:AI-2E family transporter [Palleronia sediminis]TDL81304.1 AI-2E family transporter [Palleronia sediminis]